MIVSHCIRKKGVCALSLKQMTCEEILFDIKSFLSYLLQFFEVVLLWLYNSLEPATL